MLASCAAALQNELYAGFSGTRLHGHVEVCAGDDEGRPIEPIWKFYPRYAVESVVKLGKWIALYAWLRRIYVRIKKDPKKLEYMDTALTPVTDHDVEDLEMFHTPSAPAFVAQEQRRQHAHEYAAVA